MNKENKMHPENERRENYPASDKEMYRIKDIDDFIKKERRHDELDRLQEVREQKKVWRNVMLFCGALNLILIILGLWGVYNGAH